MLAWLLLHSTSGLSSCTRGLLSCAALDVRDVPFCHLSCSLSLKGVAAMPPDTLHPCIAWSSIQRAGGQGLRQPTAS